MRPHPIWILAASTALGVAWVIAYVSLAENAPAAESLPAAVDAAPDEALEGAPTCAPELEPIEGGGCFAPPKTNAWPPPLLVYLHGRYGPDTQAEELDRQSRVARLATTRGFAVLALRGVQGECGAPELRDWYCWPSNERNASDGPAYVFRFAAPMEAARLRIGSGPSYLLGFSNGGYFATLIATRSLATFDAIAIAHAGPVEPTRLAPHAAPLLLVTADDDLSDGDMQKLDDELTSVGWPHALVAREGGHALPDWDVDVALTFFTRVRSEKLPLVPPLASRTRRPRAATTDDGGAESDEDAGGDAGLD